LGKGENKKELPYSPDCVKRTIDLLDKALLEVYPNLAEIILVAFEGKRELSKQEKEML
jgi:hypothetical protein